MIIKNIHGDRVFGKAPKVQLIDQAGATWGLYDSTDGTEGFIVTLIMTADYETRSISIGVEDSTEIKIETR